MIHSAVLPVLSAVAHAIANTTGVWINDLPTIPEKILTAFREKRRENQSVWK